MSYYDVDKEDRPSTQSWPEPGERAVSNFVIPSLPNVRTDQLSANQTQQIDFNTITKYVEITNTSPSGTYIKISFTREGVEGTSCLLIDGGEKISLDIAATSIYLRSAFAATYSLSAGLTAISKQNAYQPSPPPAEFPSIYNIDPPAIPVGADDTQITVTGIGFYDNSIVRWNGNDLITTYLDNVKLTAVVPSGSLDDGIGQNYVTVYNPDTQYESDQYVVYVSAPGIIDVLVDKTKLLPTSTRAEFDIIGSSFSQDAIVAINYNATDVNIISRTSTKIRFSAPLSYFNSTGQKIISVINDPAQGATADFYWTPVPIITLLSQTSGPQYFANNQITITRFFSTENVKITFGNTSEIPPDNINYQQNTLTFTIPQQEIDISGNKNVFIVTADGTSNLLAYIVYYQIYSPVVTSFSVDTTSLSDASNNAEFDLVGDYFEPNIQIMVDSNPVQILTKTRYYARVRIPLSILETTGNKTVSIINNQISPGITNISWKPIPYVMNLSATSGTQYFANKEVYFTRFFSMQNSSVIFGQTSNIQIKNTVGRKVYFDIPDNELAQIGDKNVKLATYDGTSNSLLYNVYYEALSPIINDLYVDESKLNESSTKASFIAIGSYFKPNLTINIDGSSTGFVITSIINNEVKFDVELPQISTTGQKYIEFFNDGNVSQKGYFYWTPKPVIKTITPSSGTQYFTDRNVTLVRFFSTHEAKINFGTSTNINVQTTGNYASFIIPEFEIDTVGTKNVSLSTTDGTSNTLNYEVYYQVITPQISQISPILNLLDQISINATFVVTGSLFKPTAILKIDGTEANIINQSKTHISATYQLSHFENIQTSNFTIVNDESQQQGSSSLDWVPVPYIKGLSELSGTQYFANRDLNLLRFFSTSSLSLNFGNISNIQLLYSGNYAYFTAPEVEIDVLGNKDIFVTSSVGQSNHLNYEVYYEVIKPIIDSITLDQTSLSPTATHAKFSIKGSKFKPTATLLLDGSVLNVNILQQNKSEIIFEVDLDYLSNTGDKLFSVVNDNNVDGISNISWKPTPIITELSQYSGRQYFADRNITITRFFSKQNLAVIFGDTTITSLNIHGNFVDFVIPESEIDVLGTKTVKLQSADGTSNQLQYSVIYNVEKPIIDQIDYYTGSLTPSGSNCLFFVTGSIFKPTATVKLGSNTLNIINQTKTYIEFEAPLSLVETTGVKEFDVINDQDVDGISSINWIPKPYIRSLSETFGVQYFANRNLSIERYFSIEDVKIVFGNVTNITPDSVGRTLYFAAPESEIDVLGNKQVYCTTLDGESNKLNYEVVYSNDSPVIQDVNVDVGLLNEFSTKAVFSITGSTFKPTAIVKVDNNIANILSQSKSSIVFDIPLSIVSSTGNKQILVDNDISPGGTDDFYWKPVPVITSISPLSGTQYFANNSATLIRFFSTQNIKINFGLSTNISTQVTGNIATFTIPESEIDTVGIKNVTITTDDGTSNQVQYETYYEVLTPLSLSLTANTSSLNSSSTNVEFEFFGTNIKPTANVYLGSNAVTILTQSKNFIKASVALNSLEQPGEKQFTIVNDVQPSGFSSISWTPTPYIIDLNPTSGTQYFADNQISFIRFFSTGSLSVNFGNISNIAVSSFQKQITFSAPQTELDVIGIKDVYLNSSDGLSNKLEYEVYQQFIIPTIQNVVVDTSILTTSSIDASFLITGDYFKPIAKVYVDDQEVQINQISRNSINVTVPLLLLETTGDKVFKVVNDAQNEYSTFSWTPTPFIKDLSEVSGTQYFANRSLSLTRFFSTEQASISFGNVSGITPSSISGRTLYFSAPEQEIDIIGLKKVYLSTTDGTSNELEYEVYYESIVPIVDDLHVDENLLNINSTNARFIVTGSFFKPTATVEIDGSANGISIISQNKNSIIFEASLSVVSTTGNKNIEIINDVPSGIFSYLWVPVPVIKSISPASGNQYFADRYVTITRFFSTHHASINFGSQSNISAFISGNTATFVIPENEIDTIGMKNVSITTEDGTSNVLQYEVYYQVEKPILDNITLDENSLISTGEYARFSVTGSNIKPTANIELDDSGVGLNIIDINKNNIVFDVLFSRLESEGYKHFKVINDNDVNGISTISWNPVPIIKNISPSSGIQYFANNVVTFDRFFSKHNASVSIGASSGIIPVDMTGNSATFIIPESEIDTLGIKDVYLSTSAGTSNKLSYETVYSVVTPQPTNVSVDISYLSEYATHAILDITGSFFKPTANVTVDNTPVAIVSQNKGNIRVSASFDLLETSGDKIFTVINDYVQSGSGSISWTPVPMIFDLSETSGQQYFANNILILTRYFSTSSLTITFGGTTNIQPTNIQGRKLIFDIGNILENMNKSN